MGKTKNVICIIFKIKQKVTLLEIKIKLDCAIYSFNQTLPNQIFITNLTK